jgi:hypothetical protein
MSIDILRSMFTLVSAKVRTMAIEIIAMNTSAQPFAERIMYVPLEQMRPHLSFEFVSIRRFDDRALYEGVRGIIELPSVSGSRALLY